MLKQRVITALVLAPLMICGIFFLPLFEFGIFVGLIAVVAAWEWADLAGFKKQPSRGFYAISVGVAIVISQQLLWQDPHYNVYALVAGGAWWLLALAFVLSYPNSATLWNSLSVRSVLGFLVLVPMWVGLVYLKEQAHSHWLIVYVMLLIWGADTGAYITGKLWGKSKLAPNVSPGKSWAGFYGGLATSILVAVVFAYLWNAYIETIHQNDLLKLLIIAVVTTLASVLGDLTESMFKRQRGIKDSSKLLPGHGGVLDRIDSMTAAVPVFALLHVLLN